MSTTSRNHLVMNRNDAIKNPFNIHIDAARPGLSRLSMVPIKSQWHDPGIVHQYINTPKSGHPSRNRFLKIRNLGYIRAPQ